MGHVNSNEMSFNSLLFALVCFSEKVQALRYFPLTHQLMSCSADGGITVWNMDASREEVIITHKHIHLHQHCVISIVLRFAKVQ